MADLHDACQGDAAATAAETIRLDLPATLRYLNVIGACLLAACERIPAPGPPEGFAQAVELAVQEACTNIVTHAYEALPEGQGRIGVTLSLGPGELVVDLVDSGASFDPALVAPPDLGAPQVHGFGLFLMHQLMDDVRYEPGAGHNRWRLRKRY